MPTLTVYETILYSALLRLPRDMSYDAKRFRVMETMSELGILGIKDMKIGASGQRSISGGEKRRVSIACELVTSPSILFLDEPTSGLDSYNAYNVVECLVTLARNYNRTVVCTIHQPRSNIFALFDQLILMAKGNLVYSGETRNLNTHLKSLGHPCPEGFNMADYMLDLTMYTGKATKSSSRSTLPTRNVQDEQEEELYGAEPSSSSLGLDNNDGIPGFSTTTSPTFTRAPSIIDDSMQWENELASREQDRPKPNGGLNNTGARSGLVRDTAIGIDHPSSSGASNSSTDRESPFDDGIPDDNGSHLQSLVDGFKRSHILLEVEQAIDFAVQGNQGAVDNSTPGSIYGNGKAVSTYRRATRWSQFKILADRTLKNIYRDPMLMLSHFVMAIFLGLLCGALFYKVTNDIPGFQNRMGVFFFMCALFGFSCLSILPSFAQERILFVRERANGYYSPLTYFSTKVLFDIVPLRVVPPMLMGLIIYNMVGLVEGWTEFGKFFLVLVLFNLTAAGVCLMIGIVCEEVGVANLMSSLVMLFSMLFGGLLLNKGKHMMHFFAGWLVYRVILLLAQC
jgi:ABC-type multidrug transport system ATPase subunit